MIQLFPYQELYIETPLDKLLEQLQICSLSNNSPVVQAFGFPDADFQFLFDKDLIESVFASLDINLSKDDIEPLIKKSSLQERGRAAYDLVELIKSTFSHSTCREGLALPENYSENLLLNLVRIWLSRGPRALVLDAVWYSLADAGYDLRSYSDLMIQVANHQIVGNHIDTQSHHDLIARIKKDLERLGPTKD